MSSYAASGVDEEREQAAFSRVMRPWLEKTGVARAGVEVVGGIGSGFFSAVLGVDGSPSIALTTDGVGTKILLARRARRYDTVGVDVVANNVNDLICAGADPVALVDYIAIDEPDEGVLGELARGMAAGAQEAGVAVIGGEIAQVRDMLAERGELADVPMFDLVATAIGVVPVGSAPSDGSAVGVGDVVIGLTSTGLHSNGYSLARRAVERSDISLDLLLEPTRVYVAAARALWAAGVGVGGMVHISGGGLLNLARLAAPVSYRLDRLPPSPDVFAQVQAASGASDGEMYATFNMGIGLCVVVSPGEADQALEVIAGAGYDAGVIGSVVEGADQRVNIPSAGLVGRGEVFSPA